MFNISNADALEALMKANISDVGMSTIMRRHLEKLEKEIVASVSKKGEDYTES